MIRAALGGLVSWLLGLIFKRPSSEAKAAAAAAKAETALAVEVSTNEKVQEASAAAAAVDAELLRDPDRLRDKTKWSRD